MQILKKIQHIYNGNKDHSFHALHTKMRKPVTQIFKRQKAKAKVIRPN